MTRMLYNGVSFVSVVAGDESDIDSAVAKLSGAAFAPAARMRNPSMPRKAERKNVCRLVSEYNTGFLVSDVSGRCEPFCSGLARRQILSARALTLLAHAIGPG